MLEEIFIQIFNTPVHLFKFFYILIIIIHKARRLILLYVYIKFCGFKVL